MFMNFINYNFKSGHNYEIAVRNFLLSLGFTAELTGNDDRGVDIVAIANYNSAKPKFYIQCKYQNSTVGMAPIQEVYLGTNLRGNDGHPVVITNNTVTAEARKNATIAGVEIIGAAEWQELQTSWLKGEIINKTRTGLMGILLGAATCEYTVSEKIAQTLVTTRPENNQNHLSGKLLDHRKQTIRQLYDAALISEQEASQLEQEASLKRQQAITLCKEAILSNLDYG